MDMQSLKDSWVHVYVSDHPCNVEQLHKSLASQRTTWNLTWFTLWICLQQSIFPTELSQILDTIRLLNIHFPFDEPYFEVQYFSISSAVLPGILPAISDHLLKMPTTIYVSGTRRIFKFWYEDDQKKKNLIWRRASCNLI